MIKNANECKNAMLQAYCAILNKDREDGWVWSVQGILDEMEHPRLMDLDDGGYSLAYALDFEFDQCPVSLHGYFKRVQDSDWSLGLELEYLLWSADSGTFVLEIINK
jgi:hypothetical protein